MEIDEMIQLLQAAAATRDRDDMLAGAGTPRFGAGERRLARGMRHDLSTVAPPTTGLIHGPGGLLRYPGVNQDVFHTIVGNRPGLINELPFTPSNEMSPLHEVLTGISADPGTMAEPLANCSDAPPGGTLKAGIVTFQFGQFQRSTRQVDFTRLGQVNDRAEPMDLRLVNSIGLAGGNIWGQGLTGGGNILRNEMDVVLFERAVSFNRLFARQIWTGNPANNTAQNGYMEFPGLQLLVQKNWKDAINGRVLPSLYPQIWNFGSRLVDENCNDLVEGLTYIARVQMDLAQRTNLAPVRFAFVMNPSLFYEITKCWPCSYLTQVCSSGSGGPTQNVDIGDQIRMRDDMRSRSYLLIDGIEWPVILDDTVPRYNNAQGGGGAPAVKAGCFRSDIWLAPLSVLGGSRAVTYMQYFNFSNADTATARATGMLGDIRVLEGGAWLETVRRTNWCFEFQAMIRPRLIVDTPHLWARIQNVDWCPTIEPRNPFPSDPYWVDGGNTTQPGPSYFKPY